MKDNDKKNTINAYDDERKIKLGEKFLRGGALICCDRKKDGTIEALFRDDTGKIIRTVFRNENGTTRKCSCGSPSTCVHIAALTAHLAKFAENGKKLLKGTEKPSYGALLLREKKTLLSESHHDTKNSYLNIFIEDGFPHLPAKWNILKLSVEIVSENKSYKGNIGNLRQLHAKDNLGGLLAHSLFSLQEKQIIRYLSFNAEYEDSFLLLSAEKTSDFFHCLSGFKRVFCASSKLSFFAEPSDLAIGLISNGGAKKIVPLLKTKLSYFNLENSNFVIGQNAVWIGISGNYFWIPGTRDVKWIRDFARYQAKFRDDIEFNAELENFRKSGIEIVSGDLIPKERKKESPTPLLLAKFASKSELNLNLLFKYSNGSFPADFSPTGLCSGTITERNSAEELKAENRILFAGFKKNNKIPGNYISTDSELSGLFLMRFASEWSSEMEIYIEPGNQPGATSQKTDMAKMETSLISEDSDGFMLNCEIRSNGEKIALEKIIKTCEENSEFLEIDSKSLVRIPIELKNFLLAIKDIIKTADGTKIRISKPQALAWNAFADENFKEAKIAKFAELKTALEKPPSEFHPSKNFSGSLREYQKDGVLWMLSRFKNGLNCILADEMGLGKTIQAISLIVEMKTKTLSPNSFLALVVCPSSLTENWQMELAKFASPLKSVVLHGANREITWNETHEADVLICSYATFKRDIAKHAEQKYELMILDEAQHIKNPETGNARSSKKIHAPHKVVLTGTPVENAPVELWSIVDFLHPGILGTHNAFKKKFMDSENQDEELKKLSVRISPLMLRRCKSDVLAQLPPKIEQMLYCDMNDTQTEAYGKILINFRNKVNDISSSGLKPGRKFELLTLLLRLRQFCCHPNLLPEEFGVKNLPSAKTELLKELLLEAGDSGQKTLVFSQFPSLLKLIAVWLNDRNVAYEYLDGSSTDRMQKVHRFNSDENCGIFLLSVKAGGFGLNLTSAERVIIYDPWWNPAVERQAADRAHRIGQTKTVTVQKLIVKNSIEEKILVLQEKKKKYFDKLLEATPSAFKNLSLEEIRDLFE